MKKISVGIDFSKKTFDATIMRREEDTFSEISYASFDNDEKGYKALLTWVVKTIRQFPEGKGRKSLIFCGENTGIPSCGLSEFLAVKGYDMWLENALTIHRKSGIVRTKNDKADSRRIAVYALRNFDSDVRLYEPDTKNYKTLSSLYAAHRILTTDKVAKINQIKSGVFDNCPQALKFAEKALASIDKQLKEIDKQIERMLRECEEFSRSYEIINSFKGVGPVTAAYLIVKTHNLKYMTEARVLGNYMGIVPSHQEQSGTSIDKPARVSRFRDRQGNAAITQGANIAIRFNPVIRDYYARLVARGVHPYKAKNNCKFKIINILMAMLASGTTFDLEKYGKSKSKWKNA